MKKLLILSSLMLALMAGYAQGTEKPLSRFKAIVASPHISVILTKGDKESIRLVCNNISEEKVNVQIKGKTLHLFLDRAKIVERQRRAWDKHSNYHNRGIYAGVTVTAYVTYTELRALEIRGEGEISCDTEISSAKFKLKAFGENEIRLASLKTRKLKTALFGENRLTILSGNADRQSYRLFGENKIDNQDMTSKNVSAHIFGEGRLRLNASNEVRLSAFGEPVIDVTGDAIVSKGIVLGHVNVQSHSTR